MEAVHGEPASSGCGARFHHGEIAPIGANGNDGGGVDVVVKEDAVVEVERSMTFSHEEADMIENGPTGFCANAEQLLDGPFRVGRCDRVGSVEWRGCVAVDGRDRYVNGAGKGRFHG